MSIMLVKNCFFFVLKKNTALQLNTIIAFKLSAYLVNFFNDIYLYQMLFIWFFILTQFSRSFYAA